MAEKSRQREPGERQVPYEKPGPPKGEADGIAAVTQALEGLDFPATKEDVLSRVKGNEEIHGSKQKTVNLRTIFLRVPDEKFDSMAGIVHVVSEATRKGESPEGERQSK